MAAVPATPQTADVATGEQPDNAAPQPQLEATVPRTAEELKWDELVRRIKLGEQDAVEELYRHFYGGIRLFLCRHLGAQELEDKVHDTFLIVLTAIQRGDLRDPARLTAFVRTVVRRQVANHIGGVIHERRDCVDAEAGAEYLIDDGESPEERVIAIEKVALMRELLDQVDDRDRELLVRFYLHEHRVEDICADLRITSDQFRLLKSRAKIRFGELGRRVLARRAFSKFQGNQKFREIL
jgi:RNA polymerase sigma-70 factor, ECF subfamily